MRVWYLSYGGSRGSEIPRCYFEVAWIRWFRQFKSGLSWRQPPVFSSSIVPVVHPRFNQCRNPDLVLKCSPPMVSLVKLPDLLCPGAKEWSIAWQVVMRTREQHAVMQLWLRFFKVPGQSGNRTRQDAPEPLFLFGGLLWFGVLKAVLYCQYRIIR